jgi:hybrid cluster-associated redox disulfide protein
MDRYMKWFVVMSIVYFFVGSVLGFFMATDAASEAVRFAHIHFNLLGFMSMMIYGVGYFILPRFNARTLRWPGLVPVHFWVSNISLVAMVVFYTVSQPLFWASSLFQILSIAFFVVNLTATIMGRAESRPEESASTTDAPLIHGDMKLSEIVDRWPSVTNTLVEEGLKAFSDPNHVENARKLGITIAMAAKRHKLDESKLLESVASNVGGRVAMEAMPSGSEGGTLIRKDDIIGDVLKKHPQTEVVFRKYYGEGCFSCPGQAYETIAQSASMHNANEQEVLEALNNTARQSN